MKFLIAADSFKGSLTSMEAAECMQEGIRRVFPEADIRMMPAADGGEGTVATVLAGLSGTPVTETVLDPLGRPIQATFAILDTGEAVIEMAQASGLLLVAPEERRTVRHYIRHRTADPKSPGHGLSKDLHRHRRIGYQRCGSGNGPGAGRPLT